jgi:hypothetical protein
MNCRKEWNQDFLNSNLTKTYVAKDLKKHRENILFEREKCLLPATQEIVARLNYTKLLQAEKDKIVAEIRILSRPEERARNFRKLNELVLLNNEYNKAIVNSMRIDGGGGQAPEIKYVRKCPVDNCRGFLSPDWNCIICHNHICEKCNEIKGADHVCNPDNVATTALLKKDSKSCPGCGQLIFKISGCSQMWCPGCHVAFNWNTLQIEKGIIHNPHYYEFRKSNNYMQTREHGDIPCGGRPHIDDIILVFEKERLLHSIDLNVFMNIHRTTVHMYAMYASRIVPEPDNESLRIKYLMNDIDETKMKRVLVQKEKAFKMTREYGDVYTTFVNVSDDLLRQLVLDFSKVEQIKETYANLRNYINNELEKVRNRYGSKAAIVIIGPNWDVQTSYK